MTAYLNALGVVCALGRDKREVARNLFAGDCCGMRNEPAGWPQRVVAGGGGPAANWRAIPAELTRKARRNNQLLLEAALQIREDIDSAIQTYGRDRIGVVLGTSTSGIDEASQGLAHYLREQQFPAEYDYQQQELGAPANFLADWLQLSGPAYVISTACTSSARALDECPAPAGPGHVRRGAVRRRRHLVQADPQRFLGAGSGLGATLQSVFGEPQRHQHRRSGGAVPDDQTVQATASRLPCSAAAPAPMRTTSPPRSRPVVAPCKRCAKPWAAPTCNRSRSTYLNLHGTATQHNDAMESQAVATLFPAGVPCSSTKPMTGHTLGAAGALEAAFCWLSLSPDNREHALPPHVWDGQPDPELPPLQWVTPADSPDVHCTSLPDEQFLCLRWQQRQPDYRRRPMIDWPLAELLPHAGDMILIDQILAFDEEQIHTRLTVKPDGLFNLPDGSLPAWVGIELMAQSVAAFAGCHARQRGDEVELGFLLGSRKFECNVESFPAGTELTIHGIRSLEDDNGMGVFECHINAPGIHATARLNVFRPPQAAQYLHEPEGVQ